MFEKILRLTGNSDLVIEVKKEGYSLKMRNDKSINDSENQLHDEDFYSEIEDYISAPKGFINAHLSEDEKTPTFNDSNLTNESIRVACMPAFPLGLSIVIRMNYRPPNSL
jgi:hypothetical protein